MYNCIQISIFNQLIKLIQFICKLPNKIFQVSLYFLFVISFLGSCQYFLKIVNGCIEIVNCQSNLKTIQLHPKQLSIIKEIAKVLNKRHIYMKRVQSKKQKTVF